MEFSTDRLRLVAADSALSAAQIAGGDVLAHALGATAPSDWPPEHNDEAHARYIHGKVTENPEQVGWWSWYILLSRDGKPDLAVAIAGFNGPPSDGAVEIGYSVVESRHRQGIATEAVSALVDRAFALGADRVEAQTLPHLTPSIGVLTKLGFTQTESDNPETIRFALARP